MKIFLLQAGRSKNWAPSSSYLAGDAYTRMVVYSTGEPGARRVAANFAGDETRECWQHESTRVYELAEIPVGTTLPDVYCHFPGQVLCRQ